MIQDVNSCQDGHARLHANEAMYLDHFVRLCEYCRSAILEAEKVQMKEMIIEAGQPSDHYEKTKQPVSIDFLRVVTLLFYLAIFKALCRDKYHWDI